MRAQLHSGSDTRSPWVWLVVLLAACSDSPKFDHLAFEDVSRPPFKVDLDAKQIRLVESIAVGASVNAVDTDGRPMPRLTLGADDAHVFSVVRAPTVGRWIFFGVKEGDAELEVRSDGHLVEHVPVIVVSQPD